MAEVAKPKKENLFGFKGELLLFIPDKEVSADEAKTDCPKLPLGVDVKYKETVKDKDGKAVKGEDGKDKTEIKTVFLRLVDNAGNDVTTDKGFKYDGDGMLKDKDDKEVKGKDDKSIKVKDVKMTAGSILKSLKTELGRIEREIRMQNNKEASTDEDKAAKKKAIEELQKKLAELKYSDVEKKEKRPYYTMLQKHLLTISKEVGKSVAKVELGDSGLEIEKQMFVKKFKMDPKGTGASMIPGKVIIEQFEVNFDTGDAKVSVAAEPGDEFILNQYGSDFIYLQSAQVVYVRKTKEITEPEPPKE